MLLTVPPDERVWPHDREELSPIDQPREREAFPSDTVRHMCGVTGPHLRPRLRRSGQGAADVRGVVDGRSALATCVH